MLSQLYITVCPEYVGIPSAMIATITQDNAYFQLKMPSKYLSLNEGDAKFGTFI